MRLASNDQVNAIFQDIPVKVANSREFLGFSKTVQLSQIQVNECMIYCKIYQISSHRIVLWTAKEILHVFLLSELILCENWNIKDSYVWIPGLSTIFFDMEISTSKACCGFCEPWSVQNRGQIGALRKIYSSFF